MNQLVVPAKTPCKFCGAPLGESSNYCATCSHHQGWLINALRYGAVTIGFFSLVATSLTYVLGVIRESRRTPALTVARFVTYGPASFVNTGAGAVFVERVDIAAANANAVLT